MADELDPRLEASLRKALHAEAESIPLLLREQDILRERRLRRGRRLAVPASLLGAAAVVAVLVATGVLGRGDPTGVGASPSPSRSPSQHPLASYEDLLSLIGPGAAAALQGEGETPSDAGEAVETDLGSVLITPSLRLAASCIGGALTVVFRTDVEELGTHRIGCSLQGPVAGSVDPFAATPAVEAHVVVIAPKGMRWRVAVADPFAGDPSASQGPVIERPSPGSGETPLVWMEVDVTKDGSAGVAVPPGTDEIVITGQCAGEGELALEIDGVLASYRCDPIDRDVFVPDNTWLDIHASVTGSVLFSLQVSARDLEHVDGVAWIPPVLTLAAPQADGTAGSRAGYAGCGLTWSPKNGRGFSDDCGPSWQPVGGALNLAPGTTVALSLADGWAIEEVDGAIAIQDQVLTSGRDPEIRPLALRKTTDGFAFGAPGAGDWSIRLTITGERRGDRFQVPYYARVLAVPSATQSP